VRPVVADAVDPDQRHRPPAAIGAPVAPRVPEVPARHLVNPPVHRSDKGAPPPREHVGGRIVMVTPPVPRPTPRHRKPVPRCRPRPKVAAPARRVRRPVRPGRAHRGRDARRRSSGRSGARRGGRRRSARPRGRAPTGSRFPAARAPRDHDADEEEQSEHGRHGAPAPHRRGVHPAAPAHPGLRPPPALTHPVPPAFIHRPGAESLDGPGLLDCPGSWTAPGPGSPGSGAGSPGWGA
jgi:hypothetical protein